MRVAPRALVVAEVELAAWISTPPAPAIVAPKLWPASGRMYARVVLVRCEYDRAAARPMGPVAVDALPPVIVLASVAPGVDEVGSSVVDVPAGLAVETLEMVLWPSALICSEFALFPELLASM